MIIHQGKWKRILTIFFLCVTASFMASAQSKVTGTVKDDTGEGLPGVAIQIKGTTSGTITDIDGSFTLEVSPDEVLLCTFIGYLPQEVPVNGRSRIEVVMELDIQQLDEVVVVGYGTMKKSDLTGAVTSINEKEIGKVRSANAIEVLQGKSAGVDIVRSSGRAGSGYSIQVRGNRSLTGNNNPLYIVDGIPFGSDITIDPNDIASVEILKDASSTAIYGSRGANGVIIITTKKGDAGKPTISFNTYAGVTKPIGSVPLGDRDYFLQLYSDLEWMRRWQFDPTVLPRQNAYMGELRTAEDPDANYDWYDGLLQNGMQQNYNFSFSGSKEKLTYSTSLSYYQEDGMIEQDKFQRFTFRVNLEGQVSDNVTIGTSTVASFSIQNERDNPFGDARKLSPLSVPYDSAGNLIAFPRFREEVVNPFIEADPDYHLRETRKGRTFSTIYAKVDFFNKALSFRSSLNFDLDFEREGRFDGVYPGVNGISVAEARTAIGTDYTIQNVFSYNKQVGRLHQLNLTAGSEIISRRTETYRGYGEDLGLANSQWYSLGSAGQNVTLALAPGEYPLVESALVSYFGRFHYSLMDRYMFQFTGRYDGSSRLARGGNQWDFFPSASFAWRITEEPFFPTQPILSDLKFRAGYGLSGNQAVDPYSSKGTVTANPLFYEFGLSEAQYNGYRTQTNENLNLGWEITEAINIGFDFEMLDGRLQGSVERYFTNTEDVLQNQSLSPHAGITSITANVGNTRNDGWEVTLNSRIISTTDFTWNTGLTYYTNNEEIVSLASGVEQDLLNGWIVGQPLDVFYDRKAIGIWQLGEEDAAAEYGLKPGDIKFADLNDDKVYNDLDRVVLGTSRPDFTFGFNNNFTFRDFDLSILAFARWGHTIRDEVLSHFSVDGLENSMMLDYWTPFNASNTTPRLDPQRTRSGYHELRALEFVDGSFIKIRDITLGYTLPGSLSNNLKMRKLRIYATVKNAFIFSEYYDGGNRYDPELRGDIEIPMPRLFAGGLNVTF